MAIKSILFVCIVVMAGQVLADDIQVPGGTMPMIDGVLSDGEWADALELSLEGGEGLWLKRSGHYLCLAVRGAKGGIGSIGLARGDSLRILHASTGLITAEYMKSGSSWSTSAGFRGPETEPGVEYSRGEIRQGARYREDNLDQFGWTANVVELGPPEDMEYLIRLGDEDEGLLALSVVFFQIKAARKYAVAPGGLEDASLDPALVAGTAGAELDFDTSRWLSLDW
jgi:hypothetical protein